MNKHITILETKRLRLKRLQPSDVAVLIDLFNASDTVSGLSVCHVNVFGAVDLLHLSLLKHIPVLLPGGPEIVR